MCKTYDCRNCKHHSVVCYDDPGEYYGQNEALRMLCYFARHYCVDDLIIEREYYTEREMDNDEEPILAPEWCKLKQPA